MTVDSTSSVAAGPAAPAARAAGPALGVLLAFASFALFSFSDASVKLLRGAVPPAESAFFGAVLGLAVLFSTPGQGGRWRDLFVTTNRPLWLLRFFALPISVIGSVVAFTHLPMAEAFVLMFLQPAFVTVMSVLFLKEGVDARRWGAVVIGFIGVLVVLRPGFRELGVGHVGAVFAGLGGGVSVVVFRALGNRESTYSLFGVGMLGSIVICGGLMLPRFVLPDAWQWLKLLGYGLLSAYAYLLLLRAARLAPAAHVSPTQYSQMLWAILLDALLFETTVDLFTLTGIVLIVGSGLLTLMREKRGMMGVAANH